MAKKITYTRPNCGVEYEVSTNTSSLPVQSGEEFMSKLEEGGDWSGQNATKHWADPLPLGALGSGRISM